MSELAVEVSDFSLWIAAHYGRVPVLDSVSLTVPAGGALGLVGESGSGKSLLTRALIGALPPGCEHAGSVRVAGIDCLAPEPRVRAQLRAVAAPVFQDALVSLSPTRRIGRHFRDVQRNGDGDWRAAATDALRRVALHDTDRVLSAYPHELSGGMRQRALIALALVRNPTVLIADEPTTALDRLVEADVLETLERLRADLGLTLILVSHDLNVARRICDEVAVLYAGQLCEHGPAERVLGDPVHPYTRGLLDAVESLEASTHPLATISGSVPQPLDFPSGCRFATRCPRATEQCARARRLLGGDDVVALCNHPLRGEAASTGEHRGVPS
jgi:peptide/nickel transport system permease protein